jgi:hypothetical protein
MQRVFLPDVDHPKAQFDRTVVDEQRGMRVNAEYKMLGCLQLNPSPIRARPSRTAVMAFAHGEEPDYELAGTNPVATGGASEVVYCETTALSFFRKPAVKTFKDDRELRLTCEFHLSQKPRNKSEVNLHRRSSSSQGFELRITKGDRIAFATSYHTGLRGSRPRTTRVS